MACDAVLEQQGAPCKGLGGQRGLMGCGAGEGRVQMTSHPSKEVANKAGRGHGARMDGIGDTDPQGPTAAAGWASEMMNREMISPADLAMETLGYVCTSCTAGASHPGSLEAGVNTPGSLVFIDSRLAQWNACGLSQAGLGQF